MIETIGDLKKRVTELETWEAEKQRYELKDIGTGRPAYVVKECMRNADFGGCPRSFGGLAVVLTFALSLPTFISLCCFGSIFRTRSAI